METVEISKTALANLIGYVLTILDFVDTESLSEENVDKVADGYVDFVEPIMKVLDRKIKGFLDISVGDIVVAFDEYTHDHNQHIIRVDSIECEEAYITDSNPYGVVFQGTDLEEDEWGDDYITVVHEGNFVKVIDEE